MWKRPGRLDVAAAKARKGDEPVSHRRAGESVATCEEAIVEAAVPRQERGRFSHHLRETFEGDAGEAFRGMGLGDAEQFIEPPHRFGERRRGEDPAAAKAGETVDLGEAAREDEVIAEMDGDRKSVVWGKRVSVRVDLGGRR